ncbi:MAG: M23 family metallopeptidase [Endomicrobia bacterium]|nr:M23 family metallopeptidase [Endomicrobiia bacterium]MCL2799255.1 M23 family metallopeptidase [Endomicrobiia bacterium]
MNTAESKETAFDKITKIFFRWSVFLTIILAIFICAQVLVKKTAAATLAAVPIVKIPTYPREQLFNDVEIRSKYLAPRVRGVRFSVYTVKSGDNLWKLAKQYGYSVHTLIGNNPQLTTYNISAGQKILIPSLGGSLHPIQENDTWDIISERYDVPAEALKLTNFGVFELVPGEYLFILGKQPAVDLMNESLQEKYALRELFVSPLGGRLTSTFGKRKHPMTGKSSMHGGIDIAVPEGTWVGAAADGVVIFAGSDAGHYGTAVFIDHKNGYVTHYGHLSSVNVKSGQKVKAHQLIAKSGSTGRATGPHLHFTVKKGDKSIDPLKFLW